MTISWRANSREEASHVPGNIWAVAVVGVLMSVYILAHSGWKNRLTFKAVRLCTETCTLCCLLSSILVLINQLGPHSPLNSVLIDDLLVTGLLSWVCQLSDHAMFYLGFAAAKRFVHKWKKYSAIAYVIVVLSLSWVPTFAICPFFVDTNSDAFTNGYFIPGQLLLVWGKIAYNLTLSYDFVQILYRVHVKKSKQYSSTAQAVSLKYIIHLFTRYDSALPEIVDSDLYI